LFPHRIRLWFKLQSPRMLQQGSAREWAARILIPLLFFAATAPTLPWLEFSSGAENLVVGTAMEMRRSGQWKIPTLAGEMRLAKPPLAAWIAAVSISDETFEATKSDDAAVRDAAYRRMAWQIRWPALFCACITLWLTYELGRVLAGHSAGVIAACALGASYAYLRYARIATTDVQLTLWVTLANLFLAQVLFQNKRWLGSLGAAVAMGLAFISKGPVALLETIVPFACFFLVQWKTGSEKVAVRKWLAPALAGAILFCLIAFPWFIYVAMRTDAWATWKMEVLRRDPVVPKGGPFTYVILFVLVGPWTAFFIAGLVRTLSEFRQRPMPRVVYALFLLLVPLLIMSFFDRKERYLLPMLPAAAILTAHGVLTLRDQLLADRTKIAAIAHWIILIALGVLLPIAGALPELSTMKKLDGGPWFSWPFAITLAIASAIIIAVGIYFSRNRLAPLIISTIAVMLLIQPALIWAYRDTRAGRSEVKDFAFQLRQRYPDIAAYSFRPGRRPPEELGIYMNRTVKSLAILDKLPAPTEPQLLFIYEEKELPLPNIPSWWVPIDELPLGKGVWHVFHHP
jgi:4-amino-4-deoxy-L-arabinose transferase-like glycosyltransferase